MNAVPSPLVENHFRVVKTAITEGLRASYDRSYDVFFELLTSIWLSPAELGEKWLSKICPNEWNILQDSHHDPLWMRKQKEEIRKLVLIETAYSISYLAENPRVIQNATTRLLVRETLAQSLPAHDQDRILAKTFLAKYHTWKAFFATLVVHDVLTPKRTQLGDPYFHIDERGDDACILKVEGHIDPIEGLEDAPIFHDIDTLKTDIGGVKTNTQRATSQILFTPSILRHHSDMVVTGEAEKQTRKAIYTSLRSISVFKKRAFGDAMNGPYREAKVSSHPA